MSWKVRRAAAKCLDAIIGSWHEMLPDFYKNISSALIARFKGIFFSIPISHYPCNQISDIL